VFVLSQFTYLASLYASKELLMLVKVAKVWLAVVIAKVSVFMFKVGARGITIAAEMGR
jgi:hypothetical protein